MSKKITMPQGTTLEVLEPTQVPSQILELFPYRAGITPTFYGKMGELYCIHSHDAFGRCGIEFYVMIDGEVYEPVEGQSKLVHLADLLSEFVHEEEDEYND